MKTNEHDHTRQLLRQALPPVGDKQEPAHDLWPVLQSRINHASALTPARAGIPWFDWALAGGVAVVAIAFPASIPVLLYYL